MFSNDLCKRLSEDSHKYSSIPESQRYSVHFDYQDLVNRLNKVKKERAEKKSPTNASIDLKPKTLKNRIILNLSKKTQPRQSLNINTERLNRNSSDQILPTLKTSRTKITSKFMLGGKSDYKIRIFKSKTVGKLHLTKKKND